MALHRELAKSIKTQMQVTGTVPWYQKPTVRTPMQTWYHESVFPFWFKYFKGPYERWSYEKRVTTCRGYGLMVDDTYNQFEPVIARALEIMPYDLATQRYRRCIRGKELSCKKYHLPVEYQNFDPMIPYLAPYVEEAKFQLQEEQELLDYHQWDRRVYCGGVSGFGETMPYTSFSTAF